MNVRQHIHTPTSAASAAAWVLVLTGGAFLMWLFGHLGVLLVGVMGTAIWVLRRLPLGALIAFIWLSK
jgi:hypothetical protein